MLFSSSMELNNRPPGHELVLRSQDEFGGLETKWRRKYGTVYRIGGCFGVSSLSNLISIETNGHLARPSGNIRSQGPRAHFPYLTPLSQNFGHGLYLRTYPWRDRRASSCQKCVRFRNDVILARTCLSRRRPSPTTQDPQSGVLLY